MAVDEIRSKIPDHLRQPVRKTFFIYLQVRCGQIAKTTAGIGHDVAHAHHRKREAAGFEMNERALVAGQAVQLRLIVRRDTPFVGGAREFPMQNPHALSRMRAPASIMSASNPSFAIIASTWREPAAMPRLTCAGILRPFRIFATVFRSQYDELVQEPIRT